MNREVESVLRQCYEEPDTLENIAGSLSLSIVDARDILTKLKKEGFAIESDNIWLTTEKGDRFFRK